MARWRLAAAALAGGLVVAPLPVVVTVEPPTLALDGSSARGTLQGHVRDYFTGPVSGAVWTWTVRNTEVAQAITSTRSAATVVPVANGTSYVVGAVGADKDSALVTVTGIVPPGCTGTATHFCPGDSLIAKVNAAAAGTAFTFGAGTYRLQTITAKANQTFTGPTPANGVAILSGARVLATWVDSGAVWYATGQIQQGTASGVCVSGTICTLPEDLFFNNVLQTRVATLAEVSAGEWYFNYSADKVYVGSDPTGQTVEVGVVPYAFQGSVAGVQIRRLTIEKYATPANIGATVWGAGGSGWLVDSNEVRWNHGAGVYGDDNWTIRRNRIRKNGWLGVVSDHATNVLVEWNTIDSNTTLNYEPYAFAAGGVKMILNSSSTMRRNSLTGNTGFGLWCDNCNSGIRYDTNTVVGSSHAGIYHEVSDDAQIIGNTITGNGLPTTRGGIWVDNSDNVDIKFNTLSGNGGGIALRQIDRSDLPARDLNTDTVMSNTISFSGAGRYTGLLQFIGDNTYFTGKNNTFKDNDYVLTGADASPFRWLNTNYNDASWLAIPMDATGSITR